MIDNSRLDYNVREMLTDNNGVCQPLRVMCSFYVKEKEKNWHENEDYDL